jgi:hypothetical protein
MYLIYYYAGPNLLLTSTSPLSRPHVPASPPASIVRCSLSVARSAGAAGVAGVAGVAVAGAAGVAGAARGASRGAAYV